MLGLIGVGLDDAGAVTHAFERGHHGIGPAPRGAFEGGTVLSRRLRRLAPPGPGTLGDREQIPVRTPDTACGICALRPPPAPDIWRTEPPPPQPPDRSTVDALPV